MAGSVRSGSADVLKHYGVKGMKWGVTHNPSGGGGSGGSAPAPVKHPVSEDARSAANALGTIQAHGTLALSNKELQSVLTRMNLERQYASLTQPTNTNRLAQGQNAANQALKIGKKVEEVRKFMESPTGEAIKTGVGHAVDAIKIAVAFKTGGASLAATKVAQVGIKKAMQRGAEA